MKKILDHVQRALFGVLSFLILAQIPAAAQAQSWATRDYCFATIDALPEAGWGDQNLTQLRARAAKIPNSLGRFWQIESPDGAVSHLMGTMHVTDPAILDLPALVEGELTQARLLMTEIDSGGFTRPELTEWLSGAGFWADGTGPLVEAPHPQILAAIYDRLQSLGYADIDITEFTYHGLMTLLLSSPCDDFNSGVFPILDDYIVLRAAIAGVPHRGLEPIRAMQTFVEDPRNLATAQAMVTVYGAYLIEPEDKTGPAIQRRIYQNGEIGLYDVLEIDYFSHFIGPDLAHEQLDLVNGYLLEQRNFDFFNAAAPELKTGGVFMAVGASHLPGETGLVSLLRQAGFTVTRLPLPGEMQ